MDQSTLTLPDIDIEAELRNDEHSHAIPFCSDHRGAEFFPVAGTIVEAICGKLLRIRKYLAAPKNHKKCPKCSSFQGKIFKCFYCGKEVVG